MLFTSLSLGFLCVVVYTAQATATVTSAIVVIMMTASTLRMDDIISTGIVDSLAVITTRIIHTAMIKLYVQ